MKTDFSSLVETRAGGVFRCHAPLSDRALEFASGNGMQVAIVRLAGSRDKNAFLNAIAETLQFPAYFGRNWDAFYDCLIDLKHGDGTLLVLRNASGFARTEPEEFAAAAAALQDAADYWQGKHKALAVVVELETPALAPELMEINPPAM
jgi:RNAse (barnase) inhibitor barstar